MGFGILLIGYFIAFSSMLTTSYFFGDVLGGIIMLLAVSKLSKYSARFIPTVAAAIVFTALSLAGGISIALKVPDSTVTMALRVIKTLSVLVLHIYLFRAIGALAADAEDMKLSVKARRNVVAISIYYIFAAANILISYFIKDEILDSYMTVIFYTYGVICVVMGSLVIHSAFARLFVIGEENAPQKESKIPLIGALQRKFHDSKAKADEENYRMMMEAQEYAAKNRRDRKKKTKKRK